MVINKINLLEVLPETYIQEAISRQKFYTNSNSLYDLNSVIRLAILDLMYLNQYLPLQRYALIAINQIYNKKYGLEGITTLNDKKQLARLSHDLEDSNEYGKIKIIDLDKYRYIAYSTSDYRYNNTLLTEDDLPAYMAKLNINNVKITTDNAAEYIISPDIYKSDIDLHYNGLNTGRIAFYAKEMQSRYSDDELILVGTAIYDLYALDYEEYVPFLEHSLEYTNNRIAKKYKSALRSYNKKMIMKKRR